MIDLQRCLLKNGWRMENVFSSQDLVNDFELFQRWKVAVEQPQSRYGNNTVFFGLIWLFYC